MALTNEQISLLLKQDAAPKPGGKRGPRVDPTSTRDISTWFKLNHHVCMKDCEHRTYPNNPTGNACWNPECKDPRPRTDRGTNIVVQIKNQFVCRYCFLDGWLL